MPYEVMMMEQELKELYKEVKAGNANKAILERIFEIQMELDNVYANEFA